MRTVYKIIFTLFIVGVVFSFSDRIFREDHFFVKTVETFKETKNLGIGIFGSSHAHAAYDPRILESQLGVSTINFGVQDQKLEATSIVADYILEKGNFDLAIIDVFAGSITGVKTEGAKIFQLKTLDLMPFSFEKYALISSVYRTDFIPAAISPTIRFHSKWYDIKDFSWTKQPTIWVGTDYYKGFRSHKDSISQKQWDEFVVKKQSQWVSDKLLDYQIEKLEQIIEVFRDRNVPMLFVNAPSYITDYSKRYKSDSELIKNFIEGKEIKFIDFNELRDSLGLKKRHFIDSGHLNAKGALIVSEYLAKYLKRNFNFSEKNKLTNYNNNRYRHIEEGFENTIYQVNLAKGSVKELEGMLNLAFYKVSNGTYEIIIETTKDEIDNIPYKLSYKFSKGSFISRKLGFKKTQDSSIYKNSITPRCIYIYKGGTYIIVPVDFPDGDINEVKFEVGKNYGIELLKINNSDSFNSEP